jgi:hypothetical protein
MPHCVAKGHVFSWVSLDEQPCSLARARGSSASCSDAIPHAKAVRNWSSSSLVKCASKSTASHYFAVLLRCSLAVRLKLIGQAARGVRRVVHGVEQRKIAQLGTTVEVAPRKDTAAHPHAFRLTSGLRSQILLDFMHKWLAIK